MYYINLLKVIVVGLLIVIGINYLVYRFITCRDKLIYIKNYREENKVASFIVDGIYGILVHVPLLVCLPVFIYYLISGKVVKKSFRLVSGAMLITPIIGISIPYISYLILDKVFMINNLFGLSNFMYFWHNIWLWISIPFFIILSIKQVARLMSAEKQTLYAYAKDIQFEYEESKRSKRAQAWVALKRDDRFLDTYLKLYDDEEEWKNDRFNIINYSVFYKILIIFSSTIMVTANIISSVIYFDILDKPYAPSPTDYKIMASPFLGDQFFYFYVYFSIIAVVIIAAVFITYLFNNKIALLGTKRKYNNNSQYVSYGKERPENKQPKSKVVIMKQLIIFGFMMVSLTVAVKLYPFDNNTFYLVDNGSSYRYSIDYPSDVQIDFDENKLLAVDAIESKYDFANYSREERYGYVMQNYPDIFDDLDELGFQKRDEDADSPEHLNVYIDSVNGKFTRNYFYINQDFTKEYKEYVPDSKDEVYLSMSNRIVVINYEKAYESKTKYIFLPTLYYSEENEESTEGFTSDQKILYELMVEQAFELTDTLFAMEMEDKGIELSP
ncbi:hypothetical protein RZE82_05870 [Mollicutes bacterium LVI A0039]|nr:hypothetical protein RZE82_05870 [Mollicutes bacterium LVI A0039]